MSATLKTFLTLAVILLLPGCKSMLATASPVYGQWVLSEIQRADSSQKIADPSVMFTLNITEDQRAGGRVACNSWHGQTRIENDRLQLLAAGVTRKHCVFDNDALRKIERSFLATLQRPQPFSASESQLRLHLDNGELWLFDRNPL